MPVKTLIGNRDEPPVEPFLIDSGLVATDEQDSSSPSDYLPRQSLPPKPSIPILVQRIYYRCCGPRGARERCLSCVVR